MVYKWKSGSYQNVDPQQAGEVCEQLSAEGRLTASNLVEASRPEDAPLHPAFEWDNDTAAEEWRRHQARNIINALIVCEEQTAQPTRAFFQIETKSSVYEPIQTIISTPDKYSELLRKAMNELAAFQRKYRQLKELDPIFKQFEQLRIA